jgi:hypothetical protein
MRGTFTTTCDYCGKGFTRKNALSPEYRNNKYGDRFGRMSGLHFCSRKCSCDYRNKRIEIDCNWCGKGLVKKRKEVKGSKSGNVFCGSSCAASFNNTQRRKTRRSKCEIMLYEMLSKAFPQLEIKPNDKEALGGYEIDIYIPQVKLGIEWNGVVHYKPIYGKDKLGRIQDIDAMKLDLAQQKGIEIIVVPDLVSSKKYVSEAFQDIRRIVKLKLGSVRK